jgi:hypothetical protein
LSVKKSALLALGVAAVFAVAGYSTSRTGDGKAAGDERLLGERYRAPTAIQAGAMPDPIPAPGKLPSASAPGSNGLGPAVPQDEPGKDPQEAATPTPVPGPLAPDPTPSPQEKPPAKEKPGSGGSTFEEDGPGSG